MHTPFVFITTHSINDGQLAEYMRQHEAFVEFVQEREPRIIAFEAYMNEAKTEVTFVFVFPDAEAADTHLQVTHDLIHQGLEITRTARLEVYGTPGPVLQQVLQFNADAGVPISIKPEPLRGFSRVPAAARAA